jgi:hypothetical protein
MSLLRGSIVLLFLVVLVRSQNDCYVSSTGTDSTLCGNTTTEACATIQQCLTNNPFIYANKTMDGSVVSIHLSDGIYSGSGFCGLTFKGYIEYDFIIFFYKRLTG